MEKLIELLNEYDGDELEYTIIDNGVKRRVKNMVDPDKPYKWCSVWWYSKSFWFIQWLVDNDKIDFDKIQIWFQLTLWYWKYDSLLMLLSISDTPIEDLISYLK